MRESRLSFIADINARLAASALLPEQKIEIQKICDRWAEHFDKRYHNAAAVGSRYLLGEKITDQKLLEMVAPIIGEMAIVLQDFASRIIYLYVLTLECGLVLDPPDLVESTFKSQEASYRVVSLFKQKKL